MIVLDTHEWVWLMRGGQGLSASQMDAVRSAEGDEIGVSIILKRAEP